MDNSVERVDGEDDAALDFRRIGRHSQVLQKSPSRRGSTIRAAPDLEASARSVAHQN